MQYFPIVNGINALLRPEGFFQRVCEALGIQNVHGAKTKIAEIAGISSNAVGLWAKDEMPGRNTLEPLAKVANYSNTSLHWLLTGEGPIHLTNQIQTDPSADALKEGVRAVVMEVMGERVQNGEESRVQELGTIDRPFDVELWTNFYDNPGPVLEMWFKHDRLPVPEGVFNTMRPLNWETASLEEKVKNVRALRGILERQIKRREKLYAPKDTENT